MTRSSVGSHWRAWHLLTEKLGRPVVVENKPGAGGSMAAEIALKAPADGYTLYLAAASRTINPALYKLSFDSIRDMTPIAQLARGPFVIAVNAKVEATTPEHLPALPSVPTVVEAGIAGFQVAIACALGHLDIRFAHEPWRPGHPKLDAGYARVVTLPPMAGTMPPAGWRMIPLGLAPPGGS